jgi:hypothetical protein
VDTGEIEAVLRRRNIEEEVEIEEMEVLTTLSRTRTTSGAEEEVEIAVEMEIEAGTALKAEIATSGTLRMMMISEEDLEEGAEEEEISQEISIITS